MCGSWGDYMDARKHCVDQDVFRPMTCPISHVAVSLCTKCNIVCAFTIVS